MFPIDTALFPSLATRKALLVVDPQNDFLAEDGALPVKIPMDLPDRIANFATTFRRNGGEVIWVRSQFEASRPIQSEQILASDKLRYPAPPGPTRGRRSRIPQETEPADCPEAFLTEGNAELPKCVRQRSKGVEMHPTVKRAVAPKDHSLVKSHYSAFKSEQLLRLLRTRFVTELFICGALTNIGVMATAVDAASHGYTITIVDDCCGYQSMMRHRNAIRQISDTTGCEVVSAETALGSLTPKQKSSKRSGRKPSAVVEVAKYPTVRRTEEADDDASLASKIQLSFEKLSLSGEPAANKPDLQTPAQASSKPLQSLGESGSRNQETDNRDLAPEVPEDADAINSAVPVKPGDDKSQTGVQATAQSQQLPEPPSETTPEKPEASPHTSAGLRPDKGHKANSSASYSEPDLSTSSGGTNTSISAKESLEPPAAESAHTSRRVNGEEPKQEETQSEDPTARTEENHAMGSRNTTPRESKPICEGDTRVIYDILPESLAENIFERIRDEVRWQRMSHQGGEVPRLVAVQGHIDQDGRMPIYRHPADESPPLLPFSPNVTEIKDAVEKQLGHPLNHVLIQFYRDGSDYISEHSDKTLDITRGSFIANVSLGAERTMTLRTKRRPKDKDHTNGEPTADGLKRQIQRARLPHNSLCKMGLTTNMRWLHSIRQDKRLEREKSASELAYDGGRISLTFRQIGTFLDRDNKLIWGQGARAKTDEEAHEVINGQTTEAVDMLRAFGKENQSTEFDWDEYYGEGFDVLHISTSPRLFLSPDPVVNMRIQLMLAEYDIAYARGSMSPQFNWKDGKSTRDPGAIPSDLPVKFVDNDSAKTTVQGDIAIMLYLLNVYGKSSNPRPCLAKQYERFQQALSLLDKHRACAGDIRKLERELEIWDRYAREDAFIGGLFIGIADFALWPVLHAMMPAVKEELALEHLTSYYEQIKAREPVAKLLSGQFEAVADPRR